MGYHLKIRDEVLEDIARSFKWYEEKNVGLGLRFVEEVEATINYISKYPEHYQIKSVKVYREAVLQIFPYMVIYSVFPCKDNPSKKPLATQPTEYKRFNSLESFPLKNPYLVQFKSPILGRLPTPGISKRKMNAVFTWKG